MVIPTYNRKSLLQQTLESVWDQTFTDFEVIVVDDGSSDGTVEFLSGFRDKLRVLVQANLGPGAARNLGAKNSTGRYISFLDSDDLWFPWTLANFFRVIQDSSARFVAGRSLPFREETELRHEADSPLSITRYADYIACGDDATSIYGCCVALERETFSRLQGFTNEPVNGEDSDLWLQLGVIPDFTVIDSPLSLGYRQHGSSAISLIDRTERGVSMMIQKEKSSQYPGGYPRASQRRRIITRHARPVSLHFLKGGNHRAAVTLYLRTFPWNVAEARVRFLVGFWIVLMRQLLNK